MKALCDAWSLVSCFKSLLISDLMRCSLIMNTIPNKDLETGAWKPGWNRRHCPQTRRPPLTLQYLHHKQSGLIFKKSYVQRLPMA